MAQSIRRRMGWLFSGLALAALVLALNPSNGLVRAQDAKKKDAKPAAESKDAAEGKEDAKAGKEKDKEKEDSEPEAKPGAPIRIEVRTQTLVGKPEEVKITADAVKFINEKLRAAWTENKVQPSRFVNDYEFIRRASLDIIGRAAKTEEIRKYKIGRAHV